MACVNSPKISIITITFNSEKTLERTIKSVVSQDYDNLEYIIIDGGSKDGTLEIVNKYRDKIAYIVSEPDKGISDAFNKGIRAATGEIIGLINSDDLLLPKALCKVASNYEEGVDVFLGNIILNDIDNHVSYIAKPSKNYCFNTNPIIICHQGTFVTKEAYEKYGTFNIKLKYMMDYDLLLRMSELGASFKRIDEELAVFNTGGITDRVTVIDGTREYALVLRLNNAPKMFYLYKVLKSFIYNSSKKILVTIGLWSWLRSKKYKKTRHI